MMASPCLLVCGVEVYAHTQLQPCRRRAQLKHVHAVSGRSELPQQRKS